MPLPLTCLGNLWLVYFKSQVRHQRRNAIFCVYHDINAETQYVAARVHETNNVNQPRRPRQGLSRLAHRVAEAGPRGAEATLGAHASPLGRLPATED
jgi:hypothetical protein